MVESLRRPLDPGTHPDVGVGEVAADSGGTCPPFAARTESA